MLEREFQYYKDHEADLVRRFEGKYIGIVGDQVVGPFDTGIEAYTILKEKYGLGHFLLQHVIPDSENRTQRYYSRVAFR